MDNINARYTDLFYYVLLTNTYDIYCNVYVTKKELQIL
jgi:hypothetical protein